MGWYLAVRAPVATALCGRLCTLALEANTLVIAGSEVLCWCAAVSWGETRLILAIARAWLGLGGPGLALFLPIQGPGWDGTQAC